jgi:tetratricopeptide (TPR) repeat protein
LELSPKQKGAFLNRGVAKISLGKIYMDENKNDEALELFNSAVGADFGQVIYMDEKNIDAYMYSTVSNYKIYEIYKRKSDYQFMRRFLSYVMEDYNNILKLINKNQVNIIISEKALIEFGLAEVYILLENEEKALKHFQNSIDYHLQNIDRDATFNIALAYNKIALIYKDRKEYNLAGVSLEESTVYYIKLLDYSFEGSKFTKASVLYDISLNMGEMGDLLTYLGNYEDAIERYNKAIGYLNKSLDIEPLDNAFLSNLASFHVDIAKIYLLLGRNREAIDLYHKAIESFSYCSNDVISLNTLAMTHTELANIYRYEMVRNQDELFMDKAKEFYISSEEHYNQALTIDKNDASTYVNLSGNYSEMGMFYIYIKENRNAIEVSKKSLNMLFQASEIDETLDLTTNIDGIKLNLAEAYKQENQYDKALEILENNLDNGDSKNRANLLTEIGRLYNYKGLTDRAKGFFYRAFNNYIQKLKRYPNHLLYLENL